jgi:phage-related protein
MATATRAAAPLTTPAASPARPPRARLTPVSVPAAQRLAGPPVMRLAPGASRAAAPVQVERLTVAPTPGEPLPESVRQPLERTFDTDLTEVRVHADAESANVVASVPARAFTHGLHVYLGPGERPTDLALMGHEVAHVIQQRGAPVFQAYGGGSDRFEQEAQAAGSASASGGRISVKERTGESRVQTIPIIDDIVDWAVDKVWDLLERFAPTLVPIFRMGVFEWLKERLGDAVQSIVDFVAAPVRKVADVVTGVRSHFSNLVTFLRDAAARIAQNDCKVVSEAADKIYQAFEGLAAPVIEKVGQYVDKIKEFFSGLWQRFGAPIWDLLKQIGGAVWDLIERVGRWIWEKTKPVRDLAARAWRWLKDLIGIGEGEEGQNGILQWFQRKASAAWEWVSQKLAPFKKQLLIVAAVLVMLSPAGPIIAIVAAAAGVLKGVQWLRQNLRNRNAVVQQQSFLRGTILPAILGAIDAVSGLVRRVANAIMGALGKVVGALGELGNIVGGIPIIGFARGLVDWIAGGFRGLLNWAIEGVGGVANWVQSGFQGLRRYARLLIDALEEILKVAGNLFRLVGGVFRRIWNAIPKCVRDPFVDWFIPLILRNIPFFSELASSPEAWQQTKAQVNTLLVQVFVNFDLIGAMKTVFRLVVRVLRIPLELIGQLLDKASQAWDLVLAKPLKFIENAIKAVLKGVGRFMTNILSHLGYGVQGWLLGAVGDKNITLPTSLTDWRGWLGMILSILGLSVDHVIELIDRRIPGAGKRLRQALDLLTGALEWVKIGLTEGPAGLWKHLKEKLSDLGNTVVNAAIGWVMKKIIAIISARLVALAASAGLSSVLEAVVAVWAAIKAAIDYATRIVTMLIKVFDAIIQIANGVIDPAAEKLEGAFRMAMPVVIGFLANYAGVGDIGEKISEIITEVRKKVDDAILALIDGVKALIQGVLNSIKSGVQKVREWWRLRKKFPASDGREHSLYYEGAAGSAELMVASNADRVRNFLTKKAAEVDALTDATLKADLKTNVLPKVEAKLIEIRAAEKALNAAQPGSQPASQAQPTSANQSPYDTLETKLEEIKPLFGRLIFSAGEYPPMRLPVYSNNVLPSGVRADYVDQARIKSHRINGPSNANQHRGHLEGWEPLRLAGLTQGSLWVRTHLFTHRFGGQPVDSNLVPAEGGTVNRSMTTLEQQADTEVRGGKTIWYDVRVTLGHTVTIPSAYQPSPVSPTGTLTQKYLSSITARWGTYKPVPGGGGFTEVEDPRKVGMTPGPPVFPTPGAATLQNIHTIGEGPLWKLVGAPFTLRNMRDLKSAINDMRAGGVNATDENDLATKLTKLTPPYHLDPALKARLAALKGTSLTF